MVKLTVLPEIEGVPRMRLFACASEVTPKTSNTITTNFFMI
jgi:hypothetical protein